MKVFLDNDTNKISIVQSVASASTMISSVAGEARDYIVSKFPENYFRSVFIDTSDAIAQQNKNDHFNNTLNKIAYPSISITPEISLDDPIGGMEKSMHLSSPNLYLRRDMDRSYKKLLIDADNEFAIYYTSDYITTNFLFKIATNSYVQNVDMAYYLKSRFQKDFFQYLNKKEIQTEIPKSFIKLIAEVKGWDMNNTEDMDNLRLYLIGVSKSNNSILKKVNQATGKECFFINEENNFLTLFADLDCPPSVIRDGQTEGEYQITFRFQVSTWLPNNFILTIGKDKLQTLSDSLISSLDSTSDQQNTGFYSVSYNMATPVGRLNAIHFADSTGADQIGQLVYSDIFTHDINQVMAPITLLDKMDSEFKSIHSFAVSDGELNLSSLLYLIIKSKDRTLGTDEYSFDYTTMQITFLESVDSDISVNLYLNRLLYDSLKVAKSKDVFYFNTNILTTLIINTGTGTENERALVKSFNNSLDYTSSDLSKSLRVRTPYGIGYVGLLDTSNTDTTDAYKVCVGYNADKTPILKKIELKQ